MICERRANEGWSKGNEEENGKARREGISGTKTDEAKKERGENERD